MMMQSKDAANQALRQAAEIVGDVSAKFSTTSVKHMNAKDVKIAIDALERASALLVPHATHVPVVHVNVMIATFRLALESRKKDLEKANDGVT